MGRQLTLVTGTEKPDLTIHKLSRQLRQIEKGILSKSITVRNCLTSERVVQLLALLRKFSDENNWNRLRCEQRPECYTDAFSAIRDLIVKREHIRVTYHVMRKVKHELDEEGKVASSAKLKRFHELQREYHRDWQSWAVEVRYVARVLKIFEDWAYENLNDWSK